MNNDSVSAQAISDKGLQAVAQISQALWPMQARPRGNPWPDGVPGKFVMNGDTPAVLDAHAQRKLNPRDSNALAVWRYLVELRGDGDRMMAIACEQVQAKLGLSSDDAVHHALARLKDAGLVEKWRTKERAAGGWVSRLIVKVYGATSVNDGTETLWVPEATAAWCHSRGRGGTRPGAGRYWKGCGKADGLKLRSEPKIIAAVEAPEGGIRPTTKQALTNQNRGPKTLTRAESGEHASKKKALPGSADFLALPGRSKRSQTPQIDYKSIPKLRQGGTKLTGDPEDRHTRHQWVRLIAQAYNTACRDVYGAPGRCRPPAAPELPFVTWDAATGTTCAPGGRDDGGAMEHWKYFPRLEAAALILREEGIAPSAWATWFLEEAWGQDYRDCKVPKPRSFLTVFAAKALGQPEENLWNKDKRRWLQPDETPSHADKWEMRTTRVGMFEKANAGNCGHALAPERVHEEQMYRLQEQTRTRRGVMHLFGFPPWYAVMRRAEIAADLADPMACFPHTA